jgi:hypothetical protein
VSRALSVRPRLKWFFVLSIRFYTPLHRELVAAEDHGHAIDSFDEYAVSVRVAVKSVLFTPQRRRWRMPFTALTAVAIQAQWSGLIDPVCVICDDISKADHRMRGLIQWLRDANVAIVAHVPSFIDQIPSMDATRKAAVLGISAPTFPHRSNQPPTADSTD